MKNHYKSLRGSSQLVKYGNKYVSIVHEVIFKNGKRIYQHRFVIYDKSLQMLELGQNFHFNQLQVEYVCGLHYDNVTQQFIICYSEMDKTSNIVKFSEEKFNKLKKYKCE